MIAFKILLFGKGFRVSRSSEEFQRLVPANTKDLSNPLFVELNDGVNWAAVCAPLYEMNDIQLGKERCLLISDTHIVCVSVALGRDAHGRPAPVVVAVSADAIWTPAGHVESTIEAGFALSSRLAPAYAESLAGAPSEVASQLVAGNFVPNGSMNAPSVAETSEWTTIVRSARNWKGVTGVATVALVGLGANVVLGTEFEAQKAQSGGDKVAGRFVRSTGQIQPMGIGLRPWMVPPRVEQADSGATLDTEQKAKEAAPAPDNSPDASDEPSKKVASDTGRPSPNTGEHHPLEQPIFAMAQAVVFAGELVFQGMEHLGRMFVASVETFVEAIDERRDAPPNERKKKKK